MLIVDDTTKRTSDYATLFELAKRCLSERHKEVAVAHLRRAIFISPERPEAYNLRGAIHELHSEVHEALNNYRVAWNYDPTYKPSQQNIERVTTVRHGYAPIQLGELREASADR